jgi:AraC-like DNA-binding protein
MEISREYLKNGMTVTETCFAVGFESPSSFSTLFKRKNGVAPVEYQKRAIFTK